MRAWLAAALALALATGCEALADIEQKRLVSADSPGSAGGQGGAGQAGAGGAGAGGGGAGGAGGQGGAQSGSSGQSGAAGSAPLKPGKRPPDPPAATSPGPERDDLFFAVRRFRLGQRDPETNAKNNLAWRAMGYDFDGVDSTSDKITATPPGVTQCLPYPGSDSGKLIDGDAGRDNNFGGQLIPLFSIFLGGSGALEDSINDDIDNGTSPTLLFNIKSLSDGPDDASVVVYAYTSSVTSPTTKPDWQAPPAFQVNPLSTTGDIGSPKLNFAGYMRDHVYASSTIAQSTNTSAITLPLGGKYGLLTVTPVATVLVIEFDPADHRKVRSATLAGVLLPQNMIDPLKDIIDRFVCGTIKNLALSQLGTIYNYADLYSEGQGFHDPTGTKFCNAISIAFEMELAPIQPITSEIESLPPASTCPP